MLDAPDCAEKPDKGRNRADGRQERQVLVHLLALARDRHIHRPINPGLSARDQTAFLAERPAPFVHAGSEDPLDRGAGPVADPVEKLVQRLAGPELILELARPPGQASEKQQLFENHRPGPEGCQDQDDHHRLHHPCGPQEHRRQRKIDTVDLGRRERRLGSSRLRRRDHRGSGQSQWIHLPVPALMPHTRGACPLFDAGHPAILGLLVYSCVARGFFMRDIDENCEGINPRGESVHSRDVTK